MNEINPTVKHRLDVIDERLNAHSDEMKTFREHVTECSTVKREAEKAAAKRHRHMMLLVTFLGVVFVAIQVWQGMN